MKIFPTYVNKDGIKEIELGNNPGITITQEPTQEVIVRIQKTRPTPETLAQMYYWGPDQKEKRQ